MAAAETLRTTTAEPLVELDQPGASLDRINRLVMPIASPVLRGVQYGDTQSPTRGQGMERDGMRDYVIGDDPRYIDWKSTARSADGVPKLRQHLKDITPSLWLATDVAQSHNKVTPGEAYMEQELAISAAMTMLLLAQKEGMPSGLMAINDHEMAQSPKLALGPNSTLRLGHQLVGLAEHEPPTKPSKEKSEQHLSDMLKRLGAVASDGLVVVVSDFRDTLKPDDEVHGWKQPLQRLRHQGNDIIAIETTNPWDFTMEGVDRPMLHGDRAAHLGFGRERRAIEANYQVVTDQQQSDIDVALKSIGAAHVKLSTADERWFTSLRKQLEKLAHRASR